MAPLEVGFYWVPCKLEARWEPAEHDGIAWLIGDGTGSDLYLIGHPLLASYTAHKSGHGLNNKLLRALLADPTAYETVTFTTAASAPAAYSTQLEQEWAAV